MRADVMWPVAGRERMEEHPNFDPMSHRTRQCHTEPDSAVKHCPVSPAHGLDGGSIPGIAHTEDERVVAVPSSPAVEQPTARGVLASGTGVPV